MADGRGTSARGAVGGEPLVRFAVDREGVLTSVEGASLGILGLGPGELVGRSAFDVCSGMPVVTEGLIRALSGESCSCAVEVGDVVFDCRCEPVEGAGGAVTGAIWLAVRANGIRSSRGENFPEADRCGAAPEGKAWFGELVEGAPDVVTVAEPDGRLRYVNPAVRRVLGYAPEELLGMASDLAGLAAAIIHPEDREYALRELAEATRGGLRRPVPVRARHKDGSWRHLEGHIDDLSDEPAVSGIVFVSRDVSRRVRAEAEARRLNRRLEATVEERTARLRALVFRLEERERVLGESEERFRLVAAATQEAIWDDNLASDERAWHGAVERVLGRPPGSVTDRAWWEERVHPEDRARVLAKVEDVLSTDGEQTWSDEYRFLRADGSYAVVVDRGYVVRDPGTGEPARMVGSMADVTERRRTEERLRESEERFRITFEAAAVGMAHVALDGGWLRVNDKLSEIVGYAREELLSLTFQDITHPDDLDADLGYVERMLNGDIQTYSMVKRYIRGDRSRVWVNLTVSLIRKPSGQPDCFVSVIEDVTARKLEELVPDGLTPREMRILQQIVAGRTNPQIAHDLLYSLGTVKLCVQRVISKLGVENRKQAASRAVEIGLVPPAAP